MSKYYREEDIRHIIIQNNINNKKTLVADLIDIPSIEIMEYPQVDGITPTLVTPEVSEEDELKFYYVDSIDDYWIGQRRYTLYYAKWLDRYGFVWTHSRYLPWGEHIVDEDIPWKKYTYPSEPREIPFTEWIVGFMRKRGSEDAISREWLLSNIEQGEKEAGGIIDTDTDNVKDFIRVAPNVIPQVPNEDAISREYMLRALNGYGKDWQEDCEIAETIRNAPSVVPTEKMGKWIKVPGYATPGGDPVWECSECGKGRHVYGIEASSYQRDVSNQQWVACPNCGAEMKGADDYERAIEQVEHDALYEPTYNSEDGSM